MVTQGASVQVVNAAKVVIALLVVQTGFGMYPVIVKRFAIESNYSPLVFCAIRDVCAFPILVLLAFLANGWVELPKFRDAVLFLFLGITGIFGGQVLFLIGVYFTGANVASIMQQLIPIITVILCVISCTESFPNPKHLSAWLKIFGILISVGGAIEMCTIQLSANSQNTNMATHSWVGYLCFIGNTSLTSIYIIAQKRFIFDKQSCVWRHYPFWVTAWSYGFGAVCICLANFIYIGQPEKFQISQEEWIPLIYAILIASSLCFLLISWATSLANATVVTAFWPFQVVPCLIGSYLVNSEALISIQYVGAAIIILGLALVVSGNYLQDKQKELKINKMRINDETQPLINSTVESP